MFIGRKTELEFLETRYKEKKGQLIVLYGRRRIGKTETLREFCKDKPHLFYSCTQCADELQLAKFSRRILAEGVGAAKYLDSFPDWGSAFRSIVELPYGDRKKIVVLDEFPYLCYGNGAIPSILQNLWDGTLKDANVMVILCGSAMSFIEKDLLGEKNPLYGRATGILRMEEMGFYDACRFFPAYSPGEKVLAYAALGGVPHYLAQFAPERSLEENIKGQILAKGSILYSEVTFLLHQELRETAIYNSIIEAIALGSTKLNDIDQKSLVKEIRKTSVYLRNLIELGIVRREFSIDAQAKEMTKASRGSYRLANNFFRFWYAFVFPNISQLEDGEIDAVYDELIEPRLHDFAAMTFEDVCKEFMKKEQRLGKLPLRFRKIGRWTGKAPVRDPKARGGSRIDETEIDFLANGGPSGDCIAGECKFQSRPFPYSDYLAFKAKLAALGEGRKVCTALFSLSGFDERIRREAKHTPSLLLYDIDQIVTP